MVTLLKYEHIRSTVKLFSLAGPNLLVATELKLSDPFHCLSLLCFRRVRRKKKEERGKMKDE
jgi:hypothetical protein